MIFPDIEVAYEVTTATYSAEAISVHRLPNGLTVTLERLPYLHTYSAGVWVRVGSGYENEEEAGLAHMLEHLVFKGTKTRSAHDLMHAIEGHGGQFNAFTSREYTCIYVKMLARHVQIGIEVLGDVIKNSLFLDLEKERNVILEEISSIEDTPDEHAHDLLTQQHWPEHPMGRPVFGSSESVSRLSLEDVKRFHDRWYRPHNMVVSVAGNFDEDAVLEQIVREFGCLEPEKTPAAAPAPSFQAGTQFFECDISQSHICFGFPGTRVMDQERFACEMLSNTLGGGSTSRLFEKIREEEGLAYSIYSYQSSYLTAGMFGVYAAVAPPNLHRTIELACREMRSLRDALVPEEEFESNREQIKGSILMALESTFTRMSRMAKSMLYYGRIIPVAEIIGSLDAVTTGDVQALAQRIFSSNQCALLVLGPGSARPAETAPL